MQVSQTSERRKAAREGGRKVDISYESPASLRMKVWVPGGVAPMPLWPPQQPVLPPDTVMQIK